jgi:hypothetical protein
MTQRTIAREKLFGKHLVFLINVEIREYNVQRFIAIVFNVFKTHDGNLIISIEL